MIGRRLRHSVAHFLRPLAITTLAIAALLMPATASATAPTNDNFANATLVSAFPFSATIDLAGATAEAGETSCDAGPGGVDPPVQFPSVWFRLSPVMSQVYRVTIFEDHFAGIYHQTGSGIEGLSLILCVSGASARTFSATAGETYYVQVTSGRFTSQPTAQLEIALDAEATAADQLVDLANAVEGVGPGSSLSDKVEEAQGALANGDVPGTCSILGAFINQVKAQRARSIAPSTVDSLIADATRIRAVLAC